MLIFVSLNLNKTLGKAVLVMSTCLLGPMSFLPHSFDNFLRRGQGVVGRAGRGKDGVLRSGVAQQ